MFQPLAGIRRIVIRDSLESRIPNPGPEVNAEVPRRLAFSRGRRCEPHDGGHDDRLDEHRRQALPQEDRVREADDAAGHHAALRHDVADLRLQGAGRGHLQRRGAAEALRPDAAETQDAGRGERPIVHAFHPPRDLFRQHRAEHQAESPVEPRSDQGEERHQRHGCARRRRPAGDGADDAAHRLRCGQHVSGDDDERHLEREGNQLPEAAAPCVDCLSERRRRRDERAAEDDEGGEQGEDERVGNPALGPRGERQREPGDWSGRRHEAFFMSWPALSLVEGRAVP